MGASICTFVKLIFPTLEGSKTPLILISDHAVFVRDNNSGKSISFEAIDLVMGPDRLAGHPVIDKHDFYAGEYLKDNKTVQIYIEVVVIGLSEDKIIHFGNHIEWWNKKTNSIISESLANSTDSDDVEPALRLPFQGNYDSEEDDFEGQMYFAEMLREGSIPEQFQK